MGWGSPLRTSMEQLPLLAKFNLILLVVFGAGGLDLGN
jgi:hypothetical protein